MAVVVALIGALSAAVGLATSWLFDTPGGPSIVAAAAAFFLVSVLVGPARTRRQAVSVRLP